MTLKDWLKLNPNHKATITAAPGDEVQAVLHGGEGIEARWVGRGTSDAHAIGNALHTRRLVVERITNPSLGPLP